MKLIITATLFSLLGNFSAKAFDIVPEKSFTCMGTHENYTLTISAVDSTTLEFDLQDRRGFKVDDNQYQYNVNNLVTNGPVVEPKYDEEVFFQIWGLNKQSVQNVYIRYFNDALKLQLYFSRCQMN